MSPWEWIARWRIIGSAIVKAISKTLPRLCVGFFVSSATGSRDLVMIVVNRAFWMSRRARTWASSLKRVGRL